LDHALELIAAASDGGKVVVSELTPSLLDPTLHLFPISFDARPIHINLLMPTLRGKPAMTAILGYSFAFLSNAALTWLNNVRAC
jgi:hypothetical protein